MSATTMHAQATSHRALRVLLRVLAVIAALVGVSILFAPHWVFMVSGAPEIAAQPLLLLFAQAFGAVALPLAYLLFRASRDPVRYVAIIDAAVIGLGIVVVLEVYAILAGGLTQYYSPALLWASVVIRALLAVALFALRPRGLANA
jgi:hypothetical protein